MEGSSGGGSRAPESSCSLWGPSCPLGFKFASDSLSPFEQNKPQMNKIPNSIWYVITWTTLFFFPGRFKFGFFKSATYKHFQSFWKRQFSLLFCRFTEFLGWQGSSGCAGEPDSRWLGRRPGAPSLQGPAPGEDKAKSERGGYFTASWARRAKKPVYGQKFSLKAEFPDTFF